MNTPEPTRKTATQLPADKKHQDELLDEALAESFPASDPPSSLHADEPLNAPEVPRQRDADTSRPNPPKQG